MDDRETIFIVEDDAGVARLQQRRLERAGYAVRTFAAPDEAWPKIRGNEADLIILDYRLPEQRTGLDFYEEIKSAGHDVPAILVTGFADEALIVKALRAGMRDFVSKSPEYLDYLPEAVGRVLAQRRLEHRLHEAESQLRQAQKMEAIGRLAGGVAHDFNNILTVMLGNTEMALEDAEQGRDCRELLRDVMQAGQRAAALTRQLLAFSRRQILEPKVLNINAVVQEAERLLRRILGEDVVLTTVLEPEPRAIKVDPVQLEQILLNLTVNARDAMPRGGRLAIETKNVDLDPTHAFDSEIEPGPYVMLAVSDNGVGMDEATRGRIFEPFFTTKERGQGTGLGLATVYGIVQQSGGYIWVYSEVGHGTTFKIYLPQHGVPGAALERSQSPAAPRGGTETILLVEDETLVRSVAARMLTGQGYRVLTAAGGPDALRIAAAHTGQIHLLLTDVIMPQMSGRELAEALLAAHPQTRVLYMSGYTDHMISEHGVLAENASYLQKPFSQESLSRKVREVLDG